MLDVMNVIDILAILPYYITLIVTSFGVDTSYIQILKVLRVIRILKLTRNSRRLRCLLLTLRRCAVDIIFLYCICFLAIILFGTAVYYLDLMGGESQVFQHPGIILVYLCHAYDRWVSIFNFYFKSERTRSTHLTVLVEKLFERP